MGSDRFQVNRSPAQPLLKGINLARCLRDGMKGGQVQDDGPRPCRNCLGLPPFSYGVPSCSNCTGRKRQLRGLPGGL